MDVDWTRPGTGPGAGHPRRDGSPAQPTGWHGPPWPPPPRRPLADAVRLLLLTGVRRAAVLGAEAGEFTLDGPNPRWVVPAVRSKRRGGEGLEHVVPLSPEAVEVVKRRMEFGERLFPARSSRKHQTREAGRSDHFVTSLRKAAVERLGHPMARWTLHNLRHTLGTLLVEELGVDDRVVSLILGHTPPGLAQADLIYIRATQLAERRTALERWASLLTGN